MKEEKQFDINRVNDILSSAHFEDIKLTNHITKQEKVV